MTASLKQLLEVRGRCLADLSRAMNVDKATTTRWSRRRVPAERVLDVERETGIPRHMNRPDLYPPPQSAFSAETVDAAPALVTANGEA